MKQLLLLFFFAVPFIAGAQILEVEPNPWEGSFESDLSNFNEEVVAHAKFTNVSSEGIDVVWRRFVVDAPAEWQYRICDNTACYPTQTASNYNPPAIEDYVHLEPGDTSLLDVHLLPRQVAGSGHIRLELKLLSDLTTVVATADYYIDVLSTVSVDEAVIPTIQLYPNPASDFIQLKNGQDIDQLVLFNAIGKQVRRFTVYNDGIYNVSDLPNGVYMVSMIDEDDGVVKTVRLMKRSYTP